MPSSVGLFTKPRFCLVALWIALMFTAWRSSLYGQESIQTAKTEAARPDVGNVPTPQHIVNLMLELANVKKTDLLYDLGCGDGRIVVTAAKKYGCRALGVDIDPERVRESRANVKAANLESLVTITQGDIFELDLSEADVVTLYLLAKLNEKLIPQLEKMKPGSRIVSHDFGILGVEPDIEVTCYSRIHGMRDTIYLWEVPLTKLAADDPDLTERDRLNDVKSYISQYPSQRVLLVLVISAMLLAALLWWFRKRLGVIKVNLTIDRG